MTERDEVIKYCLTFGNVFEDYPFHDDNWTVMRCRKNRKIFAWIFEREGHIWVNVKMCPQWRDFWRNTYEAVLPAYHLNKEHWSSVILNGTIPEEEIRRMIGESYDLVKPKKKAVREKRGNRKKHDKGQGKKTESVC